MLLPLSGMFFSHSLDTAGCWNPCKPPWNFFMLLGSSWNWILVVQILSCLIIWKEFKPISLDKGSLGSMFCVLCLRSRLHLSGQGLLEITYGWKQIVMNRSLIWKKWGCSLISKDHHWIQLTLAIFIQSLFFFFLEKLVEKIVGLQPQKFPKEADYPEIFLLGFRLGYIIGLHY